MAAPKHVAKKLREMLGNEAGESMVEWLEERDTHVDDLRRETHAEFTAVRQEIGALREEMRAGFAALESKMTQSFAALESKMTQVSAALESKMTQDSARLESKMTQGSAAMEVKFAQRNAELMKWALGFWIASLLGVVGALVALTRVPR